MRQSAAEIVAVGALVGGTSVALGPAPVAVHAANGATVALLWTVARLLSIGRVMTAAAALGYTFLPGALGLHRAGGAAAVAVPLLLAAYAVVLASARRRPAAGEAAAAGLTAAAVLLDPAALLLAPAIPWQRRVASLSRPAAAALALGWSVLAVVVLRTPAPSAGVDVSMTLLVPAAAAAFAARQRALRPLATAVLVMTAVGVLDGWQRTAVVAVALPVAALLLAAVLGRAGRETRSLSAAAPIVLVLFAALAGPVAAAVSPSADRPARVGDPAATAQQQAVRWIQANIGPEATVAADPVIGATARRVGVSARIVPNDGSTPADLVVGPGAAGRAGNSRLVAAFGEGPARVEVQRARPAPVAAAEAREAAARRAAGADLAANPRLELGPAARAALLDGMVDARLLTVLAAFARDHQLSVSAFPTVEGEAGAGALARVVRIAAVEREPLLPGGLAQQVIENWLGAQRPPHVPLAIELLEDGRAAALQLTYDAATEVRLTSERQF